MTNQLNFLFIVQIYQTLAKRKPVFNVHTLLPNTTLTEQMRVKISQSGSGFLCTGNVIIFSWVNNEKKKKGEKKKKTDKQQP